MKLSADKKAISPADGTDDVHVTVKVADASGRQVANAVPVTLTVESGPGEFPTGKSITFTPGTDIDLIDGCAAIEFRSYYAGKTVIKASSPGLKGDSIQIVSRNAPAYVAGRSAETRERPYKRFTAQERDAQVARYGQSGTGARREGEPGGFEALFRFLQSSGRDEGVRWRRRFRMGAVRRRQGAMVEAGHGV